MLHSRQHDPDFEQAVRRLAQDGLLELSGAQVRTSRRWQGAMARAAAALVMAGEKNEDIRVPIVHSLLEFYGQDMSAPDLLPLVEAMLWAELETQGGVVH